MTTTTTTTTIYSNNGFLSFSPSPSGEIASVEEYMNADRSIGSIFEALEEGEIVLLWDCDYCEFQLDEDLDLVSLNRGIEYSKKIVPYTRHNVALDVDSEGYLTARFFTEPSCTNVFRIPLCDDATGEQFRIIDIDVEKNRNIVKQMFHDWINELGFPLNPNFKHIKETKDENGYVFRKDGNSGTYLYRNSELHFLNWDGELFKVECELS